METHQNDKNKPQRMNKDGEDRHRLQTTHFKNIGYTFQDAKTVT